MPRLLVRSAVIAFALLAFLYADDYDDQAARLSQILHWSVGQTIAEIGSGEGQMSFDAASQVGPTGHVYTTELNDSKLAHLKEEVSRRRLKNVDVLKADRVGLNLPDACCESIFMRRVYHHLQDPAATDAALFRALKPGGEIAVIDFPPDPTLPPVEDLPAGRKGHGIDKEIVTRDLQGAGFTVEHAFKWSGHDYCVVARRPDGSH